MTTAARPIRVLLVDDSKLVRFGVQSALHGRHPDVEIEVVGEADSVATAVAEAARLKPDVVLLDIRLPDGNGFMACRRILADFPATRVLVLTSFSNDEFVYDAIVSGAHGYLMKEIDPTELIDSVRRAAAGESILGAGLTERVLQLVRSGTPHPSGQPISTLSHQERRVLAEVAEGKTNKEIGDKLGLSDNTVKNYLASVFEKLNVKRRSQAAALFVQQDGSGSGPGKPLKSDHRTTGL